MHRVHPKPFVFVDRHALLCGEVGIRQDNLLKTIPRLIIFEAVLVGLPGVHRAEHLRLRHSRARQHEGLPRTPELWCILYHLVPGT